MAIPVYLVHFNAPDWCRSATESILASDIAVAVTVINNGGDLDLDERVEVVALGSNLGFARGANVALRRWIEGSDPVCVVGSHDLHVEPSTIRMLVQAANRAPAFGILAPNVPTNYVGPLLDEHQGIEERTELSGTCLLFRRPCIQAIGMFHEAFGSYGEDNEICIRAREHGWKVGRVPDAMAYGLGTRHGAARELNSIANGLLVSLRRSGVRGLSRRYRHHAWLLRESLRGRGEVSASLVARALVLGTARVVRGTVQRPPKAGR